jgi:hypothetical protein
LARGVRRPVEYRGSTIEDAGREALGAQGWLRNAGERPQSEPAGTHLITIRRSARRQRFEYYAVLTGDGGV